MEDRSLLAVGEWFEIIRPMNAQEVQNLVGWAGKEGWCPDSMPLNASGASIQTAFR